MGYDQNYYSFFIGLSIVILISFLFHRASLKTTTKALFASILLLDWVAILRLGSRGVLGAILVASAWLFIRNSRNVAKTITNLALIACLVFVILHLPGRQIMDERLHSKDIATMSRRLPLWKASIDHIEASSGWEMLFGGGTDAGKYALMTKLRGRVPLSSHNQFLETFMDYGMCGLAALLWLIYTGFRQSWLVRGYSGDIRTGIVVFTLVRIPHDNAAQVCIFMACLRTYTFETGRQRE